MNKKRIKIIALIASFFIYTGIFSQSPTSPALGFNVFVENNATLNTNESEGSIAIGGDLILRGNYRVSIHDCGEYTVGGLKIGLLVDGKIDFGASSNGQLYVNSNYYAKIGDGTGAKVWYTDQNNATSPIRITQTNNYNSSTRVMLQANATTLGNVSASNNPVIEDNLIDFSAAFQAMRTSSTNIAQNVNNAQLTNPNGQTIPNTNLPSQVKINLQNGINYLNVTGADLNNVSVFTYNNQPSATKILVINVDASGTFNWNVWNQAGVGIQNAPYILYNFYNTTQLNINGNSTIEGTVFAPFADINKTVNQSNIEGQIIGKSIVHSGGEMHCAKFDTTIPPFTPDCGIEKTNGGGFYTKVTSVVNNGGSYTIEILVSHDGCGGPSCKELSHFSVKAAPGSYSNVSWAKVTGGNISGNIALSLGNNDPFDGFKLDNVSGIGDGKAGSFRMTYTLTSLQQQDFLAKAGNNYTQIASFSIADFQSIMNCQGPSCDTANNSTSNISISENETKTLIGSPAGGTWSIVSGGGTINDNIYTPADVNTNTDVTIRYTIAADGSCPATTSDVTFTVTPICTTASNTTSSDAIVENETKTLIGSPAGGTWSIVSGGGTINGNIYTPADINSNTDVTIRYTIAADGSCPATTSDVTFTVTPVCENIAENTTSTASITEGETKELTSNTESAPSSTIEVNVDGFTLGQNPQPARVLQSGEVLRITGNGYYNGTITVRNGAHVVVCGTVTIYGSVSIDNGGHYWKTSATGFTGSFANNGTIHEGPTSCESGTWSIISGGGTINGNTYTPADVNTNTDVTIRYTIAADGSCPATTSDVTFTVTPICTTASNTTTADAIVENETKTLIGSPAGGTWSIVSGGGTINGNIYTPANITSNRNVKIRYTIAADGSCTATTSDVTFTVTPVCNVPTNTVPGNQTTTENIDRFSLNGVQVSDPLGNPLTVRVTVTNGTLSVIVRISGGRNLPTQNGPGDITITGSANEINGYLSTLSYTPNPNFSGTDTFTITSSANCNSAATVVDTFDIIVTPNCIIANNTTSTDSIVENETKTLIGNPAGGTWSIVSGGGTINGNIYTPADVNTNTDVTIRYTIAADGSCPATTSDVTFTVTPICTAASNTTTADAIVENETKTLIGNPAGGTWSIVSGGGTINGNTYTPADVNTNTDVTIRYTIAADGSCTETSSDVTFTVTPIINVPEVSQDFESGDRNIESAECWVFGGFSITSTDKINGNFSARSGAINSTKGSFFLKSPWVEFANGDITFDIKLNNNDDQEYYVEISIYSFDPTHTYGEGSLISSYTHTLQTPHSNVETLSYSVPTNIANDGNPYRIYLNVYNQSGNRNRRAIIDDWSIPGTNVSVPSNNCLPTNCVFAANNTTTSSIDENQTKTLTATPAGGTWSIVSGGGTINGNIYTPADINSNTDVTIRYTIAADGSCPATTSDVTFTVTPICTTASNTTLSTSITEYETKTLTASPAGGSWSIVSGGGTINGNTYTPADINSNTDVTIRYTIAADGSCVETSSDVTFTVTPIIVQPTESFYPLEPALCFNICVEKDLIVSDASVVGAVAVGGDLTINGDYSISTIECGCFEVENLKIGLIVNGRVKYPLDGTRNSGVVRIENANQYVKIGDDNNESISWFKDPQNAPAPIRITPSRTYDVNSYIQLTGTSPSLGVDANNNPIFEENLVDFGSMFQQLRTNSLSLSQNPHNATLKDSNNNIISNVGLPASVQISFNDGVNYLNITGADLNTVQNFTAQNSTSTDRLLVINVDAPGDFDWNIWSQNGFAPQDATNIIYNFYNTTKLTILSTNSVFGTILAPNADIIRPAINQPKTGYSNKSNSANQGTILGQIVGKSLTQNSGTVDCSKFESSISSLKSGTGSAPIAEFSVDNATNCLEGNEFNFTNTSNTNGVLQPNDPITYLWNFGDGTTSTLMNPTKTYAGYGTFTVTLTATNTFGSNSTSTQVTVLQPINHPTVTQSVTNTGNGSITREFTITNAAYFDSFEWSLDGGVTMVQQNQNPGVFTFDTAGTYTVSVFGTKDGCSRSIEIPVTVASAEVTTGNAGGVESESLGDAISKIYVNRKKNSIPTEFVKSEENLYNKAKLKQAQPYQGKGQTMLDMFPTQLVAGNIANVTSPTDILDYTIADEVLSVDFSVNGKTKGVVLGIKTSDKVYNHTKASCDRLRGAEILTVQSVQLEGYNFLMQAIKQRSGVVEHAISFAVAKNNNDDNYSIQTNWYVNHYTKFNDMYNFQVWATNPEDTQKLVKDILANLQSFIPVVQNEKHRMPRTYAAKVSRVANNLVLKLRSDKGTIGGEIEMEEKYSETAGNVKQRYNPINAKAEQIVLIDIKDAYEYDGLIKVNGQIEDAFYHADGNWGLDFDSKYTKIERHQITNNFDRIYNEDELAINRNVEIKATSDYDYLTIYKSLLPGTLSDDYTQYKYLAFTAKGSGLIELGLIKASIEDWKQQYRVMVDLSKEEQTYYVPFDIYTSTGTQDKIVADDLTTLTFTFLPVEAQTKELDLTISNVKFVKAAGSDGITVEKQEVFENELMAYPNPSKGNVNLMLFSKTDTNATITLTDVTGKTIHKSTTDLTIGKNELEFNFNVKAGIYLLKVSSNEANYGTTKIIFR
ncbi:collagen-binding domain-containing protein [Polaribacter sp.]|uniref:collagen-binding domain-containing protein n=3 Tax=Polaribacter sp. TaxID=1920175 RepID=UPI004047A59C